MANRAVAWVAAACFAAGCDRLDDDHKPYTPFGAVSAEPASAPEGSASAAPAATEPTSFKPARVSRAEPGATRWALGGATFDAPSGLRFVSGLVGKFGDAAPSGQAASTLVAWMETEKRGPDELWLFPTGGKPKRLAKVPAFVPTGPGCETTRELTHSGPGVVTMDATGECEGARLKRAPNRAVVVVAPDREQPELLTLRLAAPAPGERYRPRVAAEDLDEDGRADVTLIVSLHAGDRKFAQEARIVWFDRAAGLSRDPREPRKSFDAMASLEVVRSSGENTSRDVPARVSNARRLYGTLCAAAGVPRILLDDRSPLECGELKHAMTQLVKAEVLAALTRKDIREAVGALSREPWFGAELSGKDGDEVRAKVYSGLDLVEEIDVERLAPTPLSGLHPRLSPLAFEEDGSVSVVTPGGVYRQFPGTDALDVSEEEEPWPTMVIGKDGHRVVAVSYSCDRSDVQILSVANDGTPRPPISTLLLAPRPGNCGVGYVPPIPPRGVGWFDDAPTLVIGGSLLGPHPSERARPRGGPYSPNGAWMITQSRLGLLLTGPGKPQLWRPKKPDVTKLTDCVVSNGAKGVACVSHGRVVYLTR